MQSPATLPSVLFFLFYTAGNLSAFYIFRQLLSRFSLFESSRKQNSHRPFYTTVHLLFEFFIRLPVQVTPHDAVPQRSNGEMHAAASPLSSWLPCA